MNQSPPKASEAKQRTRLRIRFTKTGDLKWISHRDLARVWERLLRRANLQLAFSEGFHPKPKISFPSALALGVEALDEIVELEIVGEMDVAKIRKDIEDQVPDGMEIIEFSSPQYALGKAKVIATRYRIALSNELHENVKEKIQSVEQQEELVFQREKRTVSCQVGDPNFSIALQDGNLEFALPNDPKGAVKASEILELLGVHHLLEEGISLQRVQVLIKEPEKTSGGS